MTTPSLPATRNRLVISLIITICVVPFALAWYLAQNPEWIETRAKTNYGHLIDPPLPLDYAELIGMPISPSEHMNEIKGRWVMVQVAPILACAEACQETAFKTGQLRLMLNKELTRVRRLLLVRGSGEIGSIKALMQSDPTLIIANLTDPIEQKLKSTLAGRPLHEGMVFLLDPFANLMMWYEPGFDPYGALRDLQKLLRVSQIG